MRCQRRRYGLTYQANAHSRRLTPHHPAPTALEEGRPLASFSMSVRLSSGVHLCCYQPSESPSPSRGAAARPLVELRLCETAGALRVLNTQNPRFVSLSPYGKPARPHRSSHDPLRAAGLVKPITSAGTLVGGLRTCATVLLAHPLR